MTQYDDPKIETVDIGEDGDTPDTQRSTPNQLRSASKGHEYYEMKNAIRRAAQRRMRTRKMASFRR